MYQTNFTLMLHYKFSLAELEKMLPFEREIYISLLNKYIEEENMRLEQQSQNNRRGK